VITTTNTIIIAIALITIAIVTIPIITIVTIAMIPISSECALIRPQWVGNAQ
jgi:hypothetical protein